MRDLNPQKTASKAVPYANSGNPPPIDRSDRNRTHVCCFGDSRSTIELPTYISPLQKLKFSTCPKIRSIAGIASKALKRDQSTPLADCCLFNLYLYPPYEALRYPGWCQTGLPVEKLNGKALANPFLRVRLSP